VDSLDHRSYIARGIDKRPGVHRGSVRPTPLSSVADGPRSRKLRVAKIAELAQRLRQSIANEEAEIAEEERAAERTARREREAAKARLLEVLALHAFADERADLKASASIVIESEPLEGGAGPTPVATAEFERMISEMLGTEWVTIGSGRRVWILIPPNDDVVVAGPGWLASDSFDPLVLDAFVKVAGAMALERPSAWMVPELRHSMGQTLEREFIAADRRGEKSKAKRAP
jgi:hypothetical protein